MKTVNVPSLIVRFSGLVAILVACGISAHLANGPKPMNEGLMVLAAGFLVAGFWLGGTGRLPPVPGSEL